MKRYVLILISLAIFLIGCTIVEQEPEAYVEEGAEISKVANEESEETFRVNYFRPGYESFDEMTESSDLIIRARVLDERVEWVNPNTTLENAIEARTEEYEVGLISRVELESVIEYYHAHLEQFEPYYRDVIFYQIEIIEIFQGGYEVGEVIDLIVFMGFDNELNRSLEHSRRYELGTELIFFLRRVRGNLDGYLALFPHQSVYKVKVESLDETTLLEPLEVKHSMLHSSISWGDDIRVEDNIPDPFEINLYMLREIARENGIIN